MSNEIKEFNFEGQNVQVIMIENEPYFLGKEVAEILGYKKTQNALSRHVDEEDVKTLKYKDSPETGRTKLWGSGEFRDKKLINESGLYSLILSSKLPSAKKFKRWVTSEVLPSIRKHGAYMTEETVEEILTNPDTIIKLATQLKKERLAHQKTKEEKLMVEQQLSEAKPKVSYYDIILQNPSLVSITQIAKDYGMSGKAMNQKLKELKLQFKQSDTWFLYAKYQNKGWTSSETKVIPTQYGDKVKMYTKWTQKGRLALYYILKEKGILPMIERNNQD